MGSEEPSELIVFGKSRNPELEEIRESVPKPHPIDDDVEELVRATSRLHVGFLFMAEGLPALQQICKFVVSADEYTGGWREFAANLGLDPVAVQCLRNSGNMLRVCELTLEAVAQKPDASLDQVISSLHRMNRVDAICQCKSPMLKLVDAVMKERDQDNNNRTEECRGGLIMPPYIPDVSPIFRVVHPLQVENTLQLWPRRQNMERQGDSQEERVITVDTSETQTQEYVYIVMLTFANDGLAAATRIADVFRQTRAPDGSRAGVVILQEHVSRVRTKGNGCVLSFFTDVDYIVPIVTRGYVEAVQTTDAPAMSGAPQCLDHKFARYIYQQMQAEYLKENCVNARVRPVIVDSYVRQAHHEFIMMDALFQSWCAESEVAELANSLLWVE